MVFTAARMIKNASDKKTQEKLIKQTYPMITINLREELKFYQGVNFKEEGMLPINVNHANEKPQFLENPDTEALAKLRWYDLGIFALAVLPVTTRRIGGSAFMRFITIGKALPQPMMQFQIYSAPYESYAPESLHIVKGGDFQVSLNKTMISDVRIQASFAKDFTVLMFGIGGQQVMRLRVKLIMESKLKLVKTYEEIKNLQFYNMAEMPYVTPGGSQRMAFTIHKKGKDKPKKKKIIPLKLDKIPKGELDQDWLTDFKSASEYWG